MFIKLILEYKSDLKILLAALLYLASAVLGYELSFRNDNLITIWPPSGIALALLLLLGRRTWPGITIGALIANLLAFWYNPQLEANSLVVLSGLIAAGYTIEALLGNYLIKKVIPVVNPFSKTIYAFRFLFVAFIISMIGSLMSVGGFWITGILEKEALIKSWFSLWVGSVAGIFLVTPLALSFRDKFRLKLEREKGVEISAFFFIISCLLIISTVEDFQDIIIRSTPLLVLPFLLWLAFRFNLTTALSCVLILAIGATYITTTKTGPFVMDSAFNTILLLQIFIGVISITTLILATTVSENQSIQKKLESFNEHLELEVDQRTAKLNSEISTRRKTEEKLLKTNQELRKTNEELDNFVYSVSHDLRAPIASVLGLINVAKLEKDSKTINGYLDMINASALQQDNFIRDILNQSRNSRLELQREEINFDNLVEEVFEQLLSGNKYGKVEKNIQISQEESFFSDKWRLKVIMNNLISNSIRYRNGKDPVVGIDISVSKQLAKVTIEDNGRGIEKKHLPKVWSMFYRATDDNAGSGLGLYIVKETVSKLSGNVDINSKVGKGTKVTFQIPQLTLN